MSAPPSLPPGGGAVPVLLSPSAALLGLSGLDGLGLYGLGLLNLAAALDLQMKKKTPNSVIKVSQKHHFSPFILWEILFRIRRER